MRNVSSLLDYRGCTLAMGNGWQRGKLRAGDRAPDAICKARREIFDYSTCFAAHTSHCWRLACRPPQRFLTGVDAGRHTAQIE